MTGNNNWIGKITDKANPENVGTIGGGMAGFGVGNVVDWYVGPLLVGAAQDLVWLVAPPVGMVFGAVVGYKVVKRLIKGKDDPDNPQSGNHSVSVEKS